MDDENTLLIWDIQALTGLREMHGLGALQFGEKRSDDLLLTGSALNMKVDRVRNRARKILCRRVRQNWRHLFLALA
jgi:hypothetical protein